MDDKYWQAKNQPRYKEIAKKSEHPKPPMVRWKKAPRWVSKNIVTLTNVFKTRGTLRERRRD